MLARALPKLRDRASKYASSGSADEDSGLVDERKIALWDFQETGFGD